MYFGKKGKMGIFAIFSTFSFFASEFHWIFNWISLKFFLCFYREYTRPATSGRIYRNWIRHYLGGAFGCCSWSSKTGLDTLLICEEEVACGTVGLGVPTLEVSFPIISRLFTISSRVPKSKDKSAFLHRIGIDFNSFSGRKLTTTLKSFANLSWPPEIPSKSRSLNLKVEL